MNKTQLPSTFLNWLEDLDLQNKALVNAYQALSDAYRSRKANLQMQSGLQAQAYVLGRFPATFAVISRVLSELRALDVEFQPQHILDFGAGPGTFSLACLEYYPELLSSLLIENNAHMQKMSQYFLGQQPRCHWQSHWQTDSVDLACAAYVLNELSESQRAALYQKFQVQVSNYIILIEPGTPLGYQNILEARQAFLAQQWQILAPCTHQLDCPLQANDWCHFAQRLERSRVHQQLKGAALNYEDEKYTYLILSRNVVPKQHEWGRVLRHPQKHKGHLRFQICSSQGETQETVISKKQAHFKTAKRTEWGDLLPVI